MWYRGSPWILLSGIHVPLAVLHYPVHRQHLFRVKAYWMSNSILWECGQLLLFPKVLIHTWPIKNGIIFLFLVISMIQILQNFRGIVLAVQILFNLENFTYFQK